MSQHRLNELKLDMRQALERTAPGPWIQNGARSPVVGAPPATWIETNCGRSIAILFSDRTPDLYKASMTEARWVFLSQPENVKMLLDEIDRLEKELENKS